MFPSFKYNLICKNVHGIVILDSASNLNLTVLVQEQDGTSLLSQHPLAPTPFYWNNSSNSNQPPTRRHLIELNLRFHDSVFT